MEANFGNTRNSRVVEKKEQCLHHHPHTYAPPSYSSPALSSTFLFKKNAVTVVGKVNVDDTMSEAVSMHYVHLHTFLCLEEMPSNTGNHFYIRTFINCRLASNVLERLCDLHAVGGKNKLRHKLHTCVVYLTKLVLVIQLLLETLELMERLKLCRIRKPQQCLQ